MSLEKVWQSFCTMNVENKIRVRFILFLIYVDICFESLKRLAHKIAQDIKSKWFRNTVVGGMKVL